MELPKTVGWDTVDNPALFDFMLNAATGVLSLGTESTPGAGEKMYRLMEQINL